MSIPKLNFRLKRLVKRLERDGIKAVNIDLHEADAEGGVTDRRVLQGVISTDSIYFMAGQIDFPYLWHLDRDTRERQLEAQRNRLLIRMVKAAATLEKKGISVSIAGKPADELRKALGIEIGLHGPQLR